MQETLSDIICDQRAHSVTKSPSLMFYKCTFENYLQVQ